jgi:hypothetical protein
MLSTFSLKSFIFSKYPNTTTLLKTTMGLRAKLRHVKEFFNVKKVERYILANSQYIHLIVTLSHR